MWRLFWLRVAKTRRTDSAAHKLINSVAMAGEAGEEIPDSGAVFTFGKSKFADNAPSKFWLKNDVPSKIACGDEHTALITENGKLFMFGSNNWGQLGLGTKTSVNKPTCVKALKSEKVKLVACGRTHTLVYTSCGNLYAAGGNNEGQLGLGDYEERASFQLVDFFTKHGPIKMLAAGSNTSAALMQDGKLYVWGDNSEGQIGLGKEAGAVTPRELSVGRRVAWVSCGYYHSAFVTVDGALFTFGERDCGKLGLSPAQLPNHKVPQHVEGISERVLQVACGGGHTVAFTENYLYSFGLGQFGQLGHGTFIFESRLARVVEHFRKGRVKHIACGENHTAVLTVSGLLYTFGDGRHGKLGLGEENFTNQFKPTLCPRFLKYSVESVTCGGCHMLVLAKPRIKGSEDVILEDDDITEDYLEKSYTELLGETVTQTNLNRSFSARVRRRERERSPEQFRMMFRTLPPLSSGYLSASLPVSSQTLPPRLPPTELHSKRDSNGLQRSGLHHSTGKVMKEQEVDGKSSAVENSEDSESVKDLGETTDLLNLTHVIKMDPGEKSLTLSPVQKKVKVVKRHGKEVGQPAQHPARSTRHKALPTELLRSPSGKSLLGDSPLSRSSYQSSQSWGSDKENALIALKETRPTRLRAESSRAKKETQPMSLADISRAKSLPRTPIHTAGPSQLMEIGGKSKSTKQPKGKAQPSQEDLSKPATKPHSAEVNRSEIDFDTKAGKPRGKAKFASQGDSGKVGSKTHQESDSKRQQTNYEEKENVVRKKPKEDQAGKEIPREVAAKITQAKHIPVEAKSKISKVKSKPVIVQSKSPDTAESDSKSGSKKYDKRDVRTGDVSTRNKHHIQAQDPTKKTKPDPSLLLSKGNRKTQKTTKAQSMDPVSVANATKSTKSESELQSETMRQNLLTGVTSFIQDVRPESPVRLLREVTTSQVVSRATASSSSQSAPQTKSGRTRTNTLAERTLSDASSITDTSEAAEEGPSKRTSATINVMPEPGPSSEETPKFQSGAKLSEEEKSDRTERECEESGGESGQISQVEEAEEGSREMTECEGLIKGGGESSSAEYDEEESKTGDLSNNSESDEEENDTSSNNVESEGERKEEESETEREQAESEAESDEERSSSVVEKGEEEEMSEINRKEKESEDEEQEEDESRVSEVEEKESSKESGEEGEEEESEEKESEDEQESAKSESDSEAEEDSRKESESGEEEGEDDEEENSISEEQEGSEGKEKSKAEDEEEWDEMESGNESEGEESGAGEEENEDSEAGEEEEAEEEKDEEEGEKDDSEAEKEEDEDEGVEDSEAEKEDNEDEGAEEDSEAEKEDDDEGAKEDSEAEKQDDEDEGAEEDSEAEKEQDDEDEGSEEDSEAEKEDDEDEGAEEDSEAEKKQDEVEENSETEKEEDEEAEEDQESENEEEEEEADEGAEEVEKEEESGEEHEEEEDEAENEEEEEEDQQDEEEREQDDEEAREEEEEKERENFFSCIVCVITPQYLSHSFPLRLNSCLHFFPFSRNHLLYSQLCLVQTKALMSVFCLFFLYDLLQDYSHRTIELSDDETNGEEAQTEDEEEEEEDDDDEEEEEREKCEKEKDGEELVEQVEQQEIKTTQAMPQEKEDVKEATVPDGPIKDSGHKDTSSPLIEEKSQSQNEAKQNKPKNLFGSNSKLSLFKRRSSTKDKQTKEKAEAPAESTTSAKPSSETPSGSSDSGDPGKSPSVEDPNPRPLRSRSATCSLL
ncbi:retinitis pigmentosa GTPase regulator b [Colossoma macropomum]|uniref:retinitis pigmentosa GTPase regulator b n=1 Tax=Colossoma macropomum TaxID=42526 RepID=UPI00186415CA|nr:retinitis pigmentosa GTPase regulator b [Colossoma macropomum]